MDIEEKEYYVTISKQRYNQLVDDSLMLNCLRNAGVDNWDGWDDACEAYHSLEDE